MSSDRLVLSTLGFGAMGITAFYGPPMPDEEAYKVLAAVAATGVTHYDTAEVYKSGDLAVVADTDKYNEATLGEYFSTVPRSSFTVATKFMPWLHPGKCDIETVTSALNASLKRLRLSYVDIYYLHRMPETIELLEEWMHSVKALVAAGKIRHVGLSEAAPAWLRRAHAIHPVSFLQQEWSVATRNLEDELVPTCRELGITIVAYSPLARNLLTLSVTAAAPVDFRATNPRYQGENFETNKQIAQQVAELGQRLGGITPAQLCLAWLYRRAEEMGVTVVPIPGSTKITNIQSNAKALDIKLSDADYRELTELGLKVAGPRGSESYQKNGMEGVRDKPV